MELQSNESRVRLSAQMTRKEADVFLAQVKNDLAAGKTNFVIDAAELEFIDSTGIGTLVQSLQLVRKAEGEMIISGLRSTALDFFRTTSLDRLFNLQDGDHVQKAAENLFSDAVDIKLDITIEARNKVCVAYLSGLMNPPDGTRHFKEQMLLAMARHQEFVLEMTRLTYLDSMSISEVVTLAHILRSSGGKVCVCGTNALISDLFRCLNLQSLIPMYDTLEQALAGH